MRRPRMGEDSCSDDLVSSSSNLAPLEGGAAPGEPAPSSLLPLARGARDAFAKEAAALIELHISAGSAPRTVGDPECTAV